ncbi:MAG TPA: GNAT family N-acetyltransferase [Gammaproteobacteria bacterium]|nr:GNAT family N-acetyltransferase [Gammaproteobacteria bacterium]
MQITAVTKADVEEIKNLARRAILEVVTVDASLKQGIIADTDRHIDGNLGNEKSVFLKCRADRVVGFILVQDSWNLSDLFVLPEAHGKGIGRLLFDSARSICESNRNRNYIRVNSSLNAEGFYRKLGFETFIPEKAPPDFVVPLIYHF